MAAAVEYAARLNDQARRVDFAGDDALGLNFNAAFGENHSVEASGDDYLITFNLTFDLGAFAENQRLVAEDVALDLGFDTQRAGKLQRALKTDRPIKETGPFALRFRHASMI